MLDRPFSRRQMLNRTAAGFGLAAFGDSVCLKTKADDGTGLTIVDVDSAEGRKTVNDTLDLEFDSRGDRRRDLFYAVEYDGSGLLPASESTITLRSELPPLASELNCGLAHIERRRRTECNRCKEADRGWSYIEQAAAYVTTFDIPPIGWGTVVAMESETYGTAIITTHRSLSKMPISGARLCPVYSSDLLWPEPDQLSPETCKRIDGASLLTVARAAPFRPLLFRSGIENTCPHCRSAEVVCTACANYWSTCPNCDKTTITANLGVLADGQKGALRLDTARRFERATLDGSKWNGDDLMANDGLWSGGDMIATRRGVAYLHEIGVQPLLVTPIYCDVTGIDPKRLAALEAAPTIESLKT